MGSNSVYEEVVMQLVTYGGKAVKFIYSERQRTDKPTGIPLS